MKKFVNILIWSALHSCRATVVPTKASRSMSLQFDPPSFDTILEDAGLLWMSGSDFLIPILNAIFYFCESNCARTELASFKLVLPELLPLWPHLGHLW